MSYTEKREALKELVCEMDDASYSCLWNDLVFYCGIDGDDQLLNPLDIIVDYTTPEFIQALLNCDKTNFNKYDLYSEYFIDFNTEEAIEITQDITRTDSLGLREAIDEVPDEYMEELYNRYL